MGNEERTTPEKVVAKGRCAEYQAATALVETAAVALEEAHLRLDAATKNLFEPVQPRPKRPIDLGTELERYAPPDNAKT